MYAPAKRLKQTRKLSDRMPVEASAWLKDCATALEGCACTLLWHTDAQTGNVVGFDVLTPGEGIVACVRI